MKKIIALVLVLVMMCTLLAACGKKECSICGEKKKCTTEEVFGKEVNICKDCEKDLNDLSNGLNDLLGNDK